MNEPLEYLDEFELGGGMRPTWRSYLLHIALLIATAITATIAGTIYPFGKTDIFPTEDPQSFSEVLQFIASLPVKYVALVGDILHQLATNQDGALVYGVSFSLSLLFILISHEMGHYVACRIYKVDATLPFFIPTPPMIGPAGTFGAFIKILSPLPSQKAVFDIGVAGPIAGFISLIPVALVGIATMQVVSPEHAVNVQGGIVFSDPLLLKSIALLFVKDLHFGVGNPFYYAAWVGLLVTALNLIPSGQLDGGHAIYALLGKRIHYWTGRIAFVVMATLSILGWFLYGSPSGFLIAVLLGVMMRIPHPEPYDQTPLDGKRKALAFATLIIFILCFVPFPIQIN
ncbi:MAG: site-2 protease family protein [Acidobacteriota bacterium]